MGQRIRSASGGPIVLEIADPNSAVGAPEQLVGSEDGLVHADDQADGAAALAFASGSATSTVHQRGVAKLGGGADLKGAALESRGMIFFCNGQKAVGAAGEKRSTRQKKCTEKRGKKPGETKLPFHTTNPVLSVQKPCARNGTE